MFRNAGILLFLLAFGAVSTPLFATTYCVSPTGSDGNTGIGWPQAMLTLQAAINAASTSGTKCGAGRRLHRTGGAEDRPAGLRRICRDGDAARAAQRADERDNPAITSSSVVQANDTGITASTVIDGFTIRNGVGTTVA